MHNKFTFSQVNYISCAHFQQKFQIYTCGFDSRLFHFHQQYSYQPHLENISMLTFKTMTVKKSTLKLQ